MITLALTTPARKPGPAGRAPLPAAPLRTRHAGGSPAVPGTTPTEDVPTELALRAARTGAPDDVARFVTAVERDVLRYIAFLRPDTDGVEDLAQETMLRAILALPRYEGRASARTWLLSIARRTVVDSVRRAAVRPRLSLSESWEREAEGRPAHALPGFEEGVALRDLLNALPDERREAFIATQMWGVSYERCAALCGCPVGTIRSRVSRARAELARMLEAAEGPESHRVAVSSSL